MKTAGPHTPFLDRPTFVGWWPTAWHDAVEVVAMDRCTLVTRRGERAPSG